MGRQTGRRQRQKGIKKMSDGRLGSKRMAERRNGRGNEAGKGGRKVKGSEEKGIKRNGTKGKGQ